MRLFCCVAGAAIWIALASPARAQEEGGEAVSSPAEPQLSPALVLQHQRRAMSVLTAWGAASVVAGTTQAIVLRDDDFWLWGGVQHALWGATDIVIGAVSLHKARHTDSNAPHEPGYWPKRARDMRRVYWINMALDVAYVTSGALLWTLAEKRGAQGSGAAIVGQGGFLFVFDIGAAVTVP